MPPGPSSTTAVLFRGLRARCPACGGGRVFVRGVQSEAACGVCGWRFERCPGHWVGGNEINLLATFTAGVVLYALAALGLGITTSAVIVAVSGTAVFSLAFYRSSRGLFYALDYLVDATPDGASAAPPSGDPGGRDPRRSDDAGPRAPGPPRSPALAASLPVAPEPVIPPPTAPRPSPATVSP